MKNDKKNKKIFCKIRSSVRIVLESKKNFGRPKICNIFKISRTIHLIKIIFKTGQIIFNLSLGVSSFYRSNKYIGSRNNTQKYFFQFLATTMALESVFWTIVTNGMTPQDIMKDNFGMFTTSLNFH